MPSLWLAAAMLYPLSGLAAWLVWRRIDVGLERKRAALRRWGWQLLFGGLWPAALYGAANPALAFVLLGLMLLAAVVTWHAFTRLQPGAAALLLPYCAWVLCAALIVAGRFWPSEIWSMTAS
jgi:tryptophan-rich sensory protein